MGFGSSNDVDHVTTLIAEGTWSIESGGAILFVSPSAVPPSASLPIDGITSTGILQGNGVTAQGGTSGGTGIVGLAGGSPSLDGFEGNLPGQGQNYGILGIGAGVGVVGQGGASSAGILGEGGTGGVGVIGRAGMGNADGVQGYGTGRFSGVAGFGDPKGEGTGVFGEGRGPQAPGVRGIGSGGNNIVPDTPVGVYGQAGAGNAYGVQGTGSGTLAGVAGFGDASGTGPGIIGTGQGTGALGVWGTGSGGSQESIPFGGAVGVFGQAGSGNTNGVEGHGSGTLAGVAGMGDLSSRAASGIGVYGQGGAPVPGSNGPGGPGLHGVGYGSAFTPLGQAVGVYGLGGAGDAPGVYGLGAGADAPGVLGTGGSTTADGVVGTSDAGNGINGQSVSGVGVFASSDSGTGLVAEGNAPGSIGLVASGELYAAQLNGNVTISGDLTVSGKKSAAVPFPDGSYRLMYCVESPESWFEDFGFAELVNGEAHVALDPSFVSVINGDSYHVFISEYDENHALYPTNRTATGFRVRAKTPATGGTFSYRIVAKRKDVTMLRFAISPHASSVSSRS